MSKIYCKSLVTIAVSCAVLGGSTSALANGDQSQSQKTSITSPVQKSEEMAAGIIIKYKNSDTSVVQQKAGLSAMKTLSQKAGVELTHHKVTALGAQVTNFNKPMGSKKALEAASKIANDPNVEYAEPNYILRAFATPNDSRYDEQWHYFGPNGINAPAAWDLSTGTGVNVAVLDTGYVDHADLSGNIVGGYDFISSSSTARDGGGRDSDARDEGDWYEYYGCGKPWSANSSWHGTHVAGTIGAVTNNNLGVAGVAYNSNIIPLRVLGKCGGTTADIADAMIWAAGGSVSGVSENPNPAKVLNLSLGGGSSCSATSQAAINSARSNGSVVVVAAGNDDKNLDQTGTNPASCDGVIAVAASDSDGDRSVWSTTQASSYGSVIDITAPGSNILSTLNSGATTPGSDSYASYGGTSMATPHVAAVAALMFSVNPNLTPDEVEQMIKDSAKSFPSGSTCNTSICGAGLLDAEAAVIAAQGGANPGETYTGYLGNGEVDYVPGGTWFYYNGGSISVALTGPSNADFDTKLERWSGGQWNQVAISETPTSNESFSYSANAGYYRISAYSYSGSGNYTVTINK